MRITITVCKYLSVAYSEHLAAAGSSPRPGRLAPRMTTPWPINGLYKTERIKPRRPWKGLDDLEIATAEWIDWYNNQWPHEYCDDLTPTEAESAHYAHHQTPASDGVSN